MDEQINEYINIGQPLGRCAFHMVDNILKESAHGATWCMMNDILTFEKFAKLRCFNLISPTNFSMTSFLYPPPKGGQGWKFELKIYQKILC